MKSTTTTQHTVREGEVWLASIPNFEGHQQGGVRPVLIVSNNVNNHYSPLVEGIPFTTAINESKLRQPQNVFFKADKNKGLSRDSLLLTNFKWPLNKYQLIECLGRFDEDDMVRVAEATICQNPYMRLALNEDFLNSFRLQRILEYK